MDRSAKEFNSGMYNKRINVKNKIEIDKNYVLSSIRKIENALDDIQLKNAKVSYIRKTLQTMKELLRDSLSGEEYMVDISMYVAWNYEEIIETLYKINALLPDHQKIDNKTFVCISLLKDNGEMYLEYPIQISLYEIILILIILCLSTFGIIAIFADILSK